MKRLMTWSALAGVVLAGAGCGALFNGGPQPVNFSSNPAGAEVWVNGTPRGTTPVVLNLEKNKNHTILFKLDGYSDFGTELSRQVSAGYVVLDVLGGLVPVIIDAATGSWYKLSTNMVHGSLTRAADHIDPDGQLTPEQLSMIRLGMPLDQVLDPGQETR